MSTRHSAQSATAVASVIPNLAALAEPPVRYVDGIAMDYFLIEMVNTLRASSATAAARAKKLEVEMVEAGLVPPPPAVPPPLAIKKELHIDSTVGTTHNISGKAKEVDEEGVRARLENIGVHVGANFTERLSRDRPLLSDTLEAIKFICKDVWAACWDKQVDNLRTNHRGVYVLQDNSFKPISRLSSPSGRQDAVKRAKVYVAMPAGIIKGSLSRLGFQSTVVPEISTLPQCTFQVKLPRST